jgi:hypothetical protein
MSPGSTGIHNGIILRCSKSENEIVLLTPYYDALWGGGQQGSKKFKLSRRYFFWT